MSLLESPNSSWFHGATSMYFGCLAAEKKVRSGWILDFPRYTIISQANKDNFVGKRRHK